MNSPARHYSMGRKSFEKIFDLEPLTKVTKGDLVEENPERRCCPRRYDLVVLGAYGHNRPRYLNLISDEALNFGSSFLTTVRFLSYRDKAESK